MLAPDSEVVVNRVERIGVFILQNPKTEDALYDVGVSALFVCCAGSKGKLVCQPVYAPIYTDPLQGIDLLK